MTKPYVQAGLPKLEFSIIKGENPREWVRKCQKYFQLFQVSEFQKTDIVEIHMEGKADVWFQGFKAGIPRISWSELAEEMQRRFEDMGQPNVVEELSKLQQTTSVLMYQEIFEELMSEVMI